MLVTVLPPFLLKLKNNFHVLYGTCYVFFGRSGSVETVGGNSEGTGTTETSTSQTPSCRALAGTYRIP